MKNVNDIDFGTNMLIDMCMKVNVYIYRRKTAHCR